SRSPDLLARDDAGNVRANRNARRRNCRARNPADRVLPEPDDELATAIPAPAGSRLWQLRDGWSIRIIPGGARQWSVPARPRSQSQAASRSGPRNASALPDRAASAEPTATRLARLPTNRRLRTP